MSAERKQFSRGTGITVMFKKKKPVRQDKRLLLLISK